MHYLNILLNFCVKYYNSAILPQVCGKVYVYAHLSRNCRCRDLRTLSGKFPDYPDSFQIIRTVFGLSGQFLGCLENFCIFRTVSKLSGQFLDFQDRNFLDCP